MSKSKKFIPIADYTEPLYFFSQQCLNLKTVRDIIGDSREAVIYGFSNCNFRGIAKALHCYQYLNFPYERVGNNGETKNICKSTITNLILENYRRALYNEPLIPMLFVLGWQGYDPRTVDYLHSDPSKTSVEFDVEGVFSKDIYSSAELRHCWRIYSELTDELKEIAKRTFIFVKGLGVSEYEIKLFEVCPFWLDPVFQHKWQTREHHPKEISQSSKRALLEQSYLLKEMSFFRQGTEGFNTNLAFKHDKPSYPK